MVLIFGLKHGVPMEKCFLGKISEETEIPGKNQLEELKNDDEDEFSSIEKLELLNGKKLKLEGER